MIEKVETVRMVEKVNQVEKVDDVIVAVAVATPRQAIPLLERSRVHCREHGVGKAGVCLGASTGRRVR